LIAFFLRKNYGVAAVETGGKQISTGYLHLDGFKSFRLAQQKEKGHPNGCPFFGGRGGT
jgi:hypothetical protein